MRNEEIFLKSKEYMPGGVNSPVRSLKDLDLIPPVIKTGKGPYIYDEDENEYIDFVGAWGPMILGHCDEDVVNSIRKTAEKAIAFGAPTKLELELAEHICNTVPNVEMIRMVNSGTEATMSAIKLARGYTGKSKIIKFAGCYHGHYDGFLVSAGSGVMTAGIPGSAGVTTESISNTLIAQYNDIESVESIYKVYGDDIAAVIIEPIAGNMGVIKADNEFMNKLDKLCKKHDSLLIFDEVMSGFRASYKGAQAYFEVKPDLITFAKIMGGGLPSGAYGGRRDIMEYLSPLGPVYQAGTMSGNPVVMSAGLTTLRKLYENQDLYEKMNKLGEALEKGISEIAEEKGIKVVINRCGAMMTIFFTDNVTVKNYGDALTCNKAIFASYYKHMLSKGIYVAPSQYEAMFLCVLHEEHHINKFLEVFRTLEL
ncbi:glutamate-1-semialdehyde 2,1-aminomutase [Candidatus Clostridium radicumherbarum]|uniref:Glutamate-1-semialdehyde 2,1-aminomutase n=1 Tax=Candidatus Clostridium radicumherbarum TaxID=3381662 RepID=A0ABW8TTU2_9CLOT